MALEGSISDQFTSSSVPRRLRLITKEYAVSNVPKIILLLLEHKLVIVKSQSRESLPIYHLSRNRYPGRWTLLEKDFLKIKDIAARFDISLFPSEFQQDMLSRVKAIVEVEWKL